MQRLFVNTNVDTNAWNRSEIPPHHHQIPAQRGSQQSSRTRGEGQRIQHSPSRLRYARQESEKVGLTV